MILKTVADYVKANNTGNRFRTWSTLSALEKDGYKGQVWVRSREPGERGWNLTDVGAAMLQFLSHSIIQHSYFTELPPEGTLRVIQGQVTEDSGEFMLGYDRSQRPLRRVLMEEGYKWIKGPAARLLLKKTLDPEDYEMLLDTLDAFPGCVVEFTMWEKAVGVLGRRLCFWEVRNY